MVKKSVTALTFGFLLLRVLSGRAANEGLQLAQDGVKQQLWQLNTQLQLLHDMIESELLRERIAEGSVVVMGYPGRPPGLAPMSPEPTPPPSRRPQLSDQPQEVQKGIQEVKGLVKKISTALKKELSRLPLKVSFFLEALLSSLSNRLDIIEDVERLQYYQGAGDILSKWLNDETLTMGTPLSTGELVSVSFALTGSAQLKADYDSLLREIRAIVNRVQEESEPLGGSSQPMPTPPPSLLVLPTTTVKPLSSPPVQRSGINEVIKLANSISYTLGGESFEHNSRARELSASLGNLVGVLVRIKIDVFDAIDQGQRDPLLPLDVFDLKTFLASAPPNMSGIIIPEGPGFAKAFPEEYAKIAAKEQCLRDDYASLLDKIRAIVNKAQEKSELLGDSSQSSS